MIVGRTHKTERQTLAAIYLRQGATGVPAMVFATVASLALAWGQIPYRLELLWGLVQALMLAMLVLQQHRHSKAELSSNAADRALRIAPSRLGVFGLGWGATAAFVPYAGIDRALAIPLIPLALCGGILALLSAAPAAARNFVIGVLVPYFVLLLVHPEWLDAKLLVVATTLLFTLWLASRASHAGLLSSLAISRDAEAATSELVRARALWEELSNSAEAFALYDAHGGLLLWNHGYARLLGRSPETLVKGMCWSDLVNRSNFVELPEAYHPSSSDLPAPRIWQGDGRWWRSAAWRLPSGHLAATHVDVTALKRHEETLVALQDELRVTRDAAVAASEAKSRFLANMSHELRTPLNAVIGFSGLILQDRARGRGNPERDLDYTRTILESGQHLLAIVEDMLDLARVEAGQLRVVEQEANLGDLMDAALKMALAGGAKALAVERRYPPGPVLATVDARLIRQALINLIGNAAKFSALGADLNLSIFTRVEGDIVLQVSDSGIGIPQHKLGLVMEPFGQVEDGEARRWHGVGLGLPIAARLAEAHGGRVELESVEGEGTTARIVLPAWRVRRSEGRLAAE